MFTGLVEATGTVVSAVRRSGNLRITVQSGTICAGSQIGASVAVNGICLTVVEKKKDIISFDAVSETVLRTTLRLARSGDVVNLERSLRSGDPVGGHFVTGHIDYEGTITGARKAPGSATFTVSVPEEKSLYLIEKGSVAVDGISLTVVEAGKRWFSVCAIPHTLSATTLGKKAAGSAVNIEFDQIGKYVHAAVLKIRPGGLTEESLRIKGYI
ncbi:MAG: riboflavin synthase [Candidatus Omnitrophota bacterium]